MSQPVVDLRSDTVTKPSAAMRQAMHDAEVGDDVYREDPTVNRLQDRAAEIFGREAGLYVMSGTMGNQTALKVLTHHGQEVICEDRSTSTTSKWACSRPFPAGSPNSSRRGRYFDLGPDRPYVRTRNDHRARTAYRTWRTLPTWRVAQFIRWRIPKTSLTMRTPPGCLSTLMARESSTPRVASARSVVELTRNFDSVTFCLSKGLGAPVGSMLVGSKEFIEESRVVRKMLGGSMRQVGVLAAAGLIALEEGPKRLHLDHSNARFLATELAQIPGIKIDAAKVVTNILFFDVSGTGMAAPEVSKQLAALGVLANPTNAQVIRMVTHLDVDRAGCERAMKVLREVVAPRKAMAS